MKTFQDLQEGLNDPNIFKAFFLAGGPGSGKSYVVRKTTGGTGLRIVNSDDIFEKYLKDAGLEMDMRTTRAEREEEERDKLRDRAKTITKKKRDNYVEGRLGLVIDGTGKDITKVSQAKNQLNELGYDTMMLFVNTSEEVAQERNAERTRTIPADMVKVMWQRVQQNIMKFQQVFGAAKFHVIDNSGGLEDPDRKENFDTVYREVQKFLNDPPTKRAAKAWLSRNTKT